MHKFFSLLKANLVDNLNPFAINTRSKNKKSRKLAPFFLVIMMMGIMFMYAEMMNEELAKYGAEFVLLALAALAITILTFMEGIYKSGNLLFKCKDDNLMLSLPVERSTVFLVRVLRFYLFELIYNSLFLVPIIISYAIHINPSFSFYIATVFALLLLPIVPIILSCVIGMIITRFASNFRFKNLIQIVLTTIIMVILIFISYNIEGLITNIAQHATSINDFIVKLYYPVGEYVKLATDFNVLELLLYVVLHLVLFAIAVWGLGKVYFGVISRAMTVKVAHVKKDYIVKTNGITKALIKKEFRRFVSSPVFVVNAGFGLVLFVIACVASVVKSDFIMQAVGQMLGIMPEEAIKYVPVVLLALIIFTSLMSSITSSMISLEGKSFNIIKVLPVKPFTIIFAKVLTAVSVIIPVLLVGDLIIFLFYKVSLLNMLMIIVASIVLPFVAELIGIIVNLKYPKMDANNDTEVVKQSTSSAVAVFAGMFLAGITVFGLFYFVTNIPVSLIVALGLSFYTLLFALLMLYLKHKGVEDFESINVP